MNKILRCAAIAAISVGFSLATLSQADAASVAVVPLINNVVDRDDLNSIYYDRAVEALKNAEDSELVDDQTLDKAIAKYTKQGVMPDKAALEGIAQEGNVDIVIVMQVDELNRRDITFDNRGELDIEIRCEGKAAYYDSVKGVYKSAKIYDEQKMEMSQGARFDVEGEMFANNVTRFVKRALGVKKITFEKPRISKAGQKGNR